MKSRRSRKRKPSPGVALQQAAFEFLREKYGTQELFSLGQFQAAAGFTDDSKSQNTVLCNDTITEFGKKNILNGSISCR